MRLPLLSCLVVVFGFRALPAAEVSFDSEYDHVKWRKACAGIDRNRDPGGWCVVAQNLVTALRYKGDYDSEERAAARAEAEALMREIVRLRIAYVGPEHPQTLHSIGGLAYLLSDKSDYSESEVLYRKALAGWEKKGLGI